MYMCSLGIKHIEYLIYYSTLWFKSEEAVFVS